MIANDNRVQIVLAAGGTGGHMFPAEALATELLRRGCRVDLITDERGQGFGNRLPEVNVHHVAAGGVAGKGLVPKIKNLARLALGYLQCRKLIKRLDPVVTVGFGGYPSVPPLLAAQQRESRTVLHEQNAVAGRANRFLMKRASKVALSFDKVRFFEELPADKMIVTGNPVRPAISALANQAYRAPRGFEPINLLIFGGSLGARSFSRHIPAGVALISPELRSRLKIVQQCRPEDIDEVAAAYKATGLAVELKSFFDDMPQRLAAAHLIVSRAGASTVTELTAAGRPSLMIPLPNAIDDHQLANARALEGPGAGWVLTESAMSPASIAERLTTILSHPDRLDLAAAAAKKLGRRDAAERLADVVMSLVPASRKPHLQTEPA
ncbi:undecaprenyldiphospho-muramoylpentapeptide beta-N-acetylglucosaminyltransferase [Dongia rigui]|uniref:UDP-N-acetylglucosamine--N-acetylmuramyl-(pentapeptide) pyrophosphoryl-undecaprenol N-acetylglucosamine transferase n=1 Tax=Dongia rigui TaxID=940149 RepID=A0ABU5DW11_9PROT|nr:undecaprenyldiphospho-muramoylpentapeptide beta-N-acetylglucosaminyltransferase [Dongia rigui]MDY0871129.1 undecaprenyldiphospho-muramoylpentapeptide beta-N-acetylglucosaminyltransferase [Dongia rigui]